MIGRRQKGRERLVKQAWKRAKKLAVCEYPGCGQPVATHASLKLYEKKKNDDKPKPVEGATVPASFCHRHFALAEYGLIVAVRQKGAKPEDYALDAPFHFLNLFVPAYAACRYADFLEAREETKKEAEK